MGTKVTVVDITNVDNSSGIATLNSNFDLVADEFDVVLYRDGSQALTGNLDMDSNRILNLPTAVNNSEPVTLGQFSTLNDSAAATAEAIAAAATSTANAALTAADVVSTGEDLAAATAAKNLAVAAAATIGSSLPVYATVALGIAGVADGEDFIVPQASGSYHFRYTRNGTTATFIGYLALSTAAIAKENGIISAIAAYSNIPTDGNFLLTRTADRSGGRQLENIFTSDPWTLNAVDALYNRDEEGNTTPVRTISANVDPLGNYEAMSVNWTNATHNLEQINVLDEGADLSAYTASISYWQRSPSDTETLGLGLTTRTASNYHSAALSPTWTQVTGINTLAPASTDYGYIPASGASVPFTAELYGTFIGLDTGPLTIPSNADLRAEVMAGHAKAALARPGVITVDNEGWVVSGNVDFDNILMTLGKPSITSFTMGCWVDFSKANYSASYVAAMAFLNTPETGTSTLHNEGAIGMDVTNYGGIYTQPNYSAVVAQSPSVILDQGPVHLAVRVNGDGTNATITTYLNGCPIVETTESFSAISPEIVSLMGQQLGRSRRQDGTSQMQDGDRLADAFFYDRAITEDELSEIVFAGQATVAKNSPPQIMVMGSFDSLTAFSDSFFWPTIAEDTLRPGIFGVLEAQGGTFYGSGTDSAYESAERQGLRRRQLKRAAMHFDEVIWLCCYGRNDIGGASRVMDPTTGGTTAWSSGRDIIDAMIFADIDSVPSSYRSKISPVLMTIPPAGDWAASDADANDILRYAARASYNADCIANYATRGYDAVLDWDDYIPSGYGSLEEAAIAGYDGIDVTIFKSDGIHWEALGGQQAAAAVVIPYLLTRVAALND